MLVIFSKKGTHYESELILNNGFLISLLLIALCLLIIKSDEYKSQNDFRKNIFATEKIYF